MTPEERYEFIKNRVRNRGRLTPIADENGNLSSGLKVARLDAGEGQVILKIGTIDEICKALASRAQYQTWPWRPSFRPK